MSDRQAPKFLIVLATATALAASLPVIYLIVRATGAGAEGWSLLARPRVREVFFNSAALAVVTTAASVAIGVPFAWLTVRSDLPLRRFWSVAGVLPLAMPSYIMAWAVIGIAGPAGLAASLLRPAGVERLPDFVYGFGGTALVITLINYPFVVLSVRPALQRMDPALEEAARSLGSGRRETLRRIVIPQLLPAITSGGLLVALYTLSDFGSPQMMRYRTFTAVIYQQFTIDRESAAMTALVLVSLTVVILAASSLAGGRAKYYTPGGGGRRATVPVPLGRLRIPAFVFCSLLFLASVVLPVASMAAWLVIGVSNGSDPGLRPALIVNSLLAAAPAAVAAVLAALPVVLFAVRHPGRYSALVDRAAWLGNALPGIVVALAFVFAVVQSPDWIFNNIYQTMPLMIGAYTIRFLPQAMGAIRPNLLQLNPALEEAARGLGRGPVAVFFTITLRVILPGLLSGGALVFLTTIKELPITLLLSPPGYENLVTEVWVAAEEGLYSQVAAPALLLVTISAFSVIFILGRERRMADE